MIDLDATGPVYRGHKLSRIIDAFISGQVDADLGLPYPKAVSTLAWARLDVRVRGNVWGLSVSDVPCTMTHYLDREISLDD